MESQCHPLPTGTELLSLTTVLTWSAFPPVLDLKSWMAESFLQLKQDKTEVLVIALEGVREKLLPKWRDLKPSKSTNYLGVIFYSEPSFMSKTQRGLFFIILRISGLIWRFFYYWSLNVFMVMVLISVIYLNPRGCWGPLALAFYAPRMSEQHSMMRLAFVIMVHLCGEVCWGTSGLQRH